MFRPFFLCLALCAVPPAALGDDDKLKPGDTLETIARDAVDLQNDLSAILETIKTKEDLERSRERIEKIRLAIDRLKGRVEKLVSEPNPEKLLANLAAVSEKNQGAAAAAEERYQAAVRKLPADARTVLQSSLGGGGVEGMMLDTIGCMGEMAEILEGIKTKADIEKARGRFADVKKRMEGLQVRAERMMRDKKNPERMFEEMEKLARKYGDKMRDSETRVQKALRALPNDVREAIEDELPFGLGGGVKPPRDIKPPVDLKPPADGIKPPLDIKPPRELKISDLKPPTDNIKPPQDIKPPTVKPPVDIKPPTDKPRLDDARRPDRKD